MELKFQQMIAQVAYTKGSNRTFMELKYGSDTPLSPGEGSSNPTFMELKYMLSSQAGWKNAF